jgi:CO dehydrogenase maturation factor
MVMDNEAGMDHMSSLTTNNVDILTPVSDPPIRGIEAAGSINRLADDLKVRAVKRSLVMNQVGDGLPGGLQGAIESQGLQLACTILKDDLLSNYDMRGNPTVSLPDDNLARTAAFAIFDKTVRAGS